MEYFEIQYYNALKRWQKAFNEQDLLARGVTVPKPGSKHLAPHTFKINLWTEGLPILRAKKMFPEKVLAETLWIMLGYDDLAFLHKHNVHYWDAFDLGDGTIGKSYGPRLRNLNGVDQLERVIWLLRKSPESRQICISFWDPANDAEIRPCFAFIQFKVTQNRYLDLAVTQRSGDALVGVPNDALLFSFFLSIIAYITGYIPGIITYTINDFHVYPEHRPQLEKYFEQYPGWRERYVRINANVSRDFREFEGYKSESLQDFLETIEQSLDFIYNFDNYKSRPFIKTELLKQGKQ